MALSKRSTVGQWLYGALFVVVLPGASWAWARALDARLSLPVLARAPWGVALVAAGLALWLFGTVELRRIGGGLPMNAFPPSKLVSTSVFAVIGHPLYVGATMVCAGWGLAVGSAAAVFVVTPTLALSAAALWWGYERIDLRARLGAPARAAWLGVPYDSPEAPTAGERGGALFVSALAPLLAGAALQASGVAERGLRIDAALVRIGVALTFATVAALVARSSSALRELVTSSWLASLLLVLSVLVLPFGPFGGRLDLAPGEVAIALLASVAAASIAARAHAARGPALGCGAALVALSIARAPANVALLAAAVFVPAWYRWPIYRSLLSASEVVANSWRESDLGRLRIIHIGWLAVPAAFVSAAYASLLVGPGTVVITVGLVVAATIGAALWAQIIEGSAALSRPYGFFGGLLGMIVYALLAPLLFGVSPWWVVGGFAAAAPFAQGLGRLRCFANGCCHGAPCDPEHGVVYRNPRTRVVRLAGLGGVPIHPTQLYSLLGNLVLGLVEMRLWASGGSLAVVSGVYFMGMGLARFVEEAYRGEPQTPIRGGLRLYQWVSIGCLVVGAILMVVPGAPRPPAVVWRFDVLLAGLGSGAFTWLVSSVDFPRSTRRFARLA